MLTKNQLRALDFKHHLSVTANAGAGKTTVLVKRFINILLNTDAKVNELVAITFTEKAASELRKKIADSIDERVLHAADTVERERCENIRDKLITANIGTIHSFCAQLLREYPVEADIDATFKVLEGVDQQLLENDSLRETFDAILNNPSDHELWEEVMDIVRMFGRRQIERFLKIFLMKREPIEWLIENKVISQEIDDDKKILEYWRRLHLDVIISHLDDLVWINSLKAILEFAEGKSVKNVGSMLDHWISCKNPEEKIAHYLQIQEAVFTKKYDLRKEFIGKQSNVSQVADDILSLSIHYQNVENLIRSFLSEDEHSGNKILLRMLKIFLKIYREAEQRYSKKKFDLSRLDFEDILIKTKCLLQNDDVRVVLARKFRFIMVDEFQDTNRLQYEILEILTSTFKSGNLFVVGDPKQSIYGFRDAEVKIFNRIKTEISKTPDGEDVVLAESFRLLPNIIDFVNRVFSKIMINSSSQYDVGYEELVQGRQNTTDGLVELLLIPEYDNDTTDSDKEGKNNDDAITQECLMIASHLQNLVTSGAVVYLKKDESSRPFQFKDAAILLRSRTHLKKLEKVFSDYQIPYILSGGIGFYQTQEVFDFLNYLKFLLAPEDDIALAGILRSPFFAISDADLFQVSLLNGDTYWDKLTEAVNDGAVTEDIKQAVAILKDHLHIANRLTIPMLVQKIFLHTGWHGIAAGLPRGDQHLANIKKFLGIARDFEAQGYTTLYDFVQRLKTLVEHEEREGQASIDRLGNCVQIMTIHAAKGLEFPVVYVPFAHQKFQYDRGLFIDPDYGIAFQVKANNDLDDKIAPSFYSFIEFLNRFRVEAEEKRIFYVACTRARDMIIISGQYLEGRKNPSYLQWMLKSLDVQSDILKTSRLTLFPMPIRVLQIENEHSKVSEIQHSLNIKIKLGGDIPGKTYIKYYNQENEIQPEEVYIESIKGQTIGEVFSATQIKTFLECPTKYYLKYILGLPEQKRYPYHFDENDEPHDILYGEIEGLLTHSVLQSINNCTITTDEIQQIIERVVISSSILSSDLSISLSDRILKNVSGLLESEFGRQIFSASDFKSEYSINLAFDDDFLTGTIDRMFKDQSGVWCFVDYKTDNIDIKDIAERAEIHKSQLLFYSLLVNRLFNQQDVTASLIFLRYPTQPVNFIFKNVEIERFKLTVQDALHKIKTKHFNQNLFACKSCYFLRAGGCICPKSPFTQIP